MGSGTTSKTEEGHVRELEKAAMNRRSWLRTFPTAESKGSSYFTQLKLSARNKISKERRNCQRGNCFIFMENLEETQKAQNELG